MTDRELLVFAAFTDTVVAPAPPLQPVARTDAAAAFASWLDQAPRMHAAALRTALAALDLAPLALGHRSRLHKLGAPARTQVLRSLERANSAPVRQAVKALKGIAFLTYYGDDRIMRTLGYDADANVARGRALRAAEGRP